MSEYTIVAAIFGSLIIGGFITLYAARESKIFIPLILLFIDGIAAASFRVAALLVAGGSGLTATYKDDLVQLLDVFFGISVYSFGFGLSIALVLLMVQIFAYFFSTTRSSSFQIRMEDERI